MVPIFEKKKQIVPEMCLVTLFMYICRGIINFIYKINLLMFLFMLKLMKSMCIAY